MTGTKPQPPEEKKPEEQKTEGYPELPPEFYMDLLDLPTCKTIGICNGCNRCER